MSDSNGKCFRGERPATMAGPAARPMEISPDAWEMLRLAAVPSSFSKILRQTDSIAAARGGDLEAAFPSRIHDGAENDADVLDSARPQNPASPPAAEPLRERGELEGYGKTLCLSDVTLDLSGDPHVTPGTLALAGALKAGLVSNIYGALGEGQGDGDGPDEETGLPDDFQYPEDFDAPDIPEEPPLVEEEIDPARTPLVLVPGIFASVLDADDGSPPGTTLWPPHITPGGGWSLSAFANVKARPVRLLGFAYHSLIQQLKQDGYVAGENLLIFAYDWRQSNLLSGIQLLREIRRFLSRFEKRHGVSHDKVDVICHSMGGLVTRTALKLGAPVRGTVFIASPHHGAPLAYFHLHPRIEVIDLGFVLVRPLVRKVLATALEGILGIKAGIDEVIQTLEDGLRRFPSVYELLPDREYLRRQRVLELGGSLFGSPVVPRTPEALYLSGGWRFPDKYTDKITGKDINFENRIRGAMRYKDWLNRALPGDNLILYSAGERTPQFARANVRTGSMEGDREIAVFWLMDPKDSPDHIGDGTVPKTSAAVKLNGFSLGPDQVGGNHLEVPNKPDVYERYIVPYLGLRPK